MLNSVKLFFVFLPAIHKLVKFLGGRKTAGFLQRIFAETGSLFFCFFFCFYLRFLSALFSTFFSALKFHFAVAS
ncbi:MAG: hypothetical protein A3E18_02400 [Candidatus Nealsonbacteria bacterium RIFCSPHIGHO2_12_FULL_38_18]|nr:MAG: hypothetical protein A3E18_02400 [Candidatus Nealsonbacteria bacterium RIFCSPHIGHO2_12_FULL_38_18]